MDTLLYQRLAADAGLTALIGAKLYPVYPTDDSKLPYVFYQRSGTEDVLTLAGPCGLKRHEYRVEVWAITADGCRAITDAIHASLSTWRVSPVQGCFMGDDLQEQTEAGYHATVTYVVWG